MKRHESGTILGNLCWRPQQRGSTGFLARAITVMGGRRTVVSGSFLTMLLVIVCMAAPSLALATSAPVPTIQSSTHPDESQWYSDDSPSFSWTVTDPSSVSGYSFTLDGNAATLPDEAADGGARFVLKWGSWGSGDGYLNYPQDVAVDRHGNVYVADEWNNRIQKFTSTGEFIRKWGSSGSGDGQFRSPTGIAVDAEGNVYVAEYYGYRVQKFSSDGVFVRKWGAEGTGDGQFDRPCGVAVDAAGQVYVADTSNNRIQKFTPDGAFITKWGGYGTADGEMMGPVGIAVDTADNVYVGEDAGDRVQKFTSEGAYIAKWGSGGTGDGQFCEVRYVDVDSESNVYVADTWTHRVQKFTSDGRLLDKWGTPGSGDGQFNQPIGVAVDKDGSAYVADRVNCRIQKFRPFADSTSYADLADGEWYMHVRAQGTSGTWGDAAHRRVRIDTTPPSSVVLAATAVGGTQIDLSWTEAQDAMSGVAEYRVYDAGTDQPLAATSLTTRSMTGLVPGTAYSFYVRAVDAAGSESVPSNTITANTNRPPISNAGADQTMHTGVQAVLDGSASSDPDGDSITYQWTITSKPEGSETALSDADVVDPSMMTDVPGDYVIELVVTDEHGAASEPDTVTVSTSNSAPVADAGPDQSITVIGDMVQLDGSQSYDNDGDTISYEWSIASKPAASTATLSDPSIVNPTFRADVRGEYVIQLTARDAWDEGVPDTVTVSFNNVQPVANAGASTSGVVGESIALDGSASTDANGDPLTYRWSFASVPDGSAVSIGEPSAMATNFIPDVAGSYVVQLLVNDGDLDSEPNAIQVQVVTVQTAAIQETQQMQELIAELPPEVFKNPTMTNALTNKLNAVIANIAAGDYRNALTKLEDDILPKTDGWATIGVVDKNDWIRDVESQKIVYPYVVELIARVRILAGG